MRSLVTVLILVMATALAQAKQAGDGRPTARPKDPPKSSITTSDQLQAPRGARSKSHGKTVETIIPDICSGC